MFRRKKTYTSSGSDKTAVVDTAEEEQVLDVHHQAPWEKSHLVNNQQEDQVNADQAQVETLSILSGRPVQAPRLRGVKLFLQEYPW